MRNVAGFTRYSPPFPGVNAAPQGALRRKRAAFFSKHPSDAHKNLFEKSPKGKGVAPLPLWQIMVSKRVLRIDDGLQLLLALVGEADDEDGLDRIVVIVEGHVAGRALDVGGVQRGNDGFLLGGLSLHPDKLQIFLNTIEKRQK